MNSVIMIDIETTGVDKQKDDILQVGMVKCKVMENGHLTSNGETFCETIHSKRTPSDYFAKKYMSGLYERCNSTNTSYDYKYVSSLMKEFIHSDGEEPKFFIGLNASGFDLPFCFEKGLLTPSSYVDTDDGQKIVGDVHYRVDEMTGLRLACEKVTGLSWKTIGSLADDISGFIQDENKDHDALYDCHKQIKFHNALIDILKSGINISKLRSF